MPLPTESILAILSVLVALPPSILIVITIVRRHYQVPSYGAYYSRGRCRYNSSYQSPSQQITYDAIQLSPFDPSTRTGASSSPQWMRPIVLTPTSSFKDQRLIQLPPPAYQPLHLHLAPVRSKSALPSR